MDKARAAAVKAVIRIHKGGWANLAAKSVLEGLQDRDKAFAGALFYGTAERLVTLDAVLQPFSKKPLAKLDVEIRAILETGLYQLLYMQVPPSAAVNESVKLARGFGKSSAAGMVNAVLRKCVDAKPEELPYKTELERVMLRYSVGEAVAKAVMQALPDEYDAFLQHSFAKQRLCLRVNTLKIIPEALAQKLEGQNGEVQAGFVPGSLYANLPGGVAGNPLFKKGYFHIQGEASQLVCALCAPKASEKVLDLCAAPGGKTATLAQLHGGGAGVTACEIHENRVPLIHETLGRLGIEGVQVLQNDGAVYNPALEGQDLVLCDVPCSGLGVLAKKPDLRYTTGEGFEALPALQLEILRTASRYVKQGGRLVYSTCTIRPEENGAVVAAFLQENTAFAVVKPANLPKGALQSEFGTTLLPQNTGMDGFFVATLARMW